MRKKLQDFMIGRYGFDAFSRFILGVALVIVIISMFIHNIVLNSIGLVLMIYTYIRMFSKNIPRRYAENEAYMRIAVKVSKFFSNKKVHITEHKTHKFYRCPKCNQDIRVPKGKGKIRITCPKCRFEFEKKT